MTWLLLPEQELWEGTKIIKYLLLFTHQPGGEAGAASSIEICNLDVTDGCPAG